MYFLSFGFFCLQIGLMANTRKEVVEGHPWEIKPHMDSLYSFNLQKAINKELPAKTLELIIEKITKIDSDTFNLAKEKKCSPQSDR